MVRLNKKKYNYIIETFKNNTKKNNTKNETILDLGEKIIKDIPKQIENFSNINAKLKDFNENKEIENFVDFPKIKGGGNGIGDEIKKALEGPFNDMKNALVKPFEEIKGFFEKIKEFFEKLKEAFVFTTEKLAYILLTILLPFFGQIITRIMYLDGSLDKPWLLFFAVPPLSLIPALMIMFGLIEKGKGGKPWDSYILLPIIVNILSRFIVDKFYTGIKATIVKYLLLLVSFIIVYYLRSYKICDSKSALLSKISSDAILTYILMGVMSILLQYLPVIGIVIKVIAKVIPYGYLFIDAVGILSVYVATNMINGSSDSYCTDTSSTQYIIQLLIGSIIITYAKKIA
jgi:hypothetical protein